MAKRQKQPQKSSWIVRMRCEVVKEVVCDDCTEEEAETNPWDHAVEEREQGQYDWTVLDVKENR